MAESRFSGSPIKRASFPPLADLLGEEGVPFCQGVAEVDIEIAWKCGLSEIGDAAVPQPRFSAFQNLTICLEAGGAQHVFVERPDQDENPVPLSL